MIKSKKLAIIFNFLLISFVLCLVNSFGTDSVSAAYSNYGAGGYGQCAYGQEGSTCSISITNNNANAYYLILNVTPTSSGSCTFQSDQVGVTTFDPNGYTLTLANQSTNTNLVNGSYNIPTTSGTPASPLVLSNNWGYRVDSYSGFSSGTTSTVTNGDASSYSTVNFAGIKSSGVTADTIASTATYSGTSVNTNVWFGLCLDTTLAVPAGSYSTSVIYSVTAN